jgi:hypothetical protein
VGLLEKMVVAQLAKKFLVFYAIGKFKNPPLDRIVSYMNPVYALIFFSAPF